MKDRVLRDYLGARLVSNNCILDYYSKVYYQANENLVDIYLDQDFEDKDVLSVVSSSDQIYTPKLLGAKKVDGFDRNRITKYYYYMRRWAITYNNEIYPYKLIDGDLTYLYNLLSKVEAHSSEEQEALDFWNRLLIDEVNVGNIFYDDMVNIGNTLFDKNIKYLKDVCLEDLSFVNIDFFKDIKSKNKYDFVLMSNIIEYCMEDISNLRIVRDNLYKLLKDKGKVICSRLINKNIGISNKEIDVFNELFSLEDYSSSKGYVYSKR